jgi:hypothetical protein
MTHGLGLLPGRQWLEVPGEEPVGKADREDEELLDEDRPRQEEDLPPGRYRSINKGTATVQVKLLVHKLP